MMDPTGLFPKGFHPSQPELTADAKSKVKYIRRSDLKALPRYYFIDFGLSVQFQDKIEARVNPVRGGDRTAPEHRAELLRSRTPHNPFWTDVYYIGNLVREEFLRVSQLFLDLSYVSLMKLRITLILAL